MTTVERPGLRERKKQQTRDTIERVALRQFTERGYDETTLAEIAEAANVSPRTIFAYFDSKEDILFCEEPAFLEQVKEMLEQRPAGTTTVEALRGFIASLPQPDEQAVLRKKIIAASPDLQLRLRAHVAQLEPILTESLARDLDAGRDDIRPALIAASMTTAFTTVRDRLADGDEEPDPQHVMKVLDEVLEFLQGGLAALTRS
jgi:AcrR family transcriptional regulator